MAPPSTPAQPRFLLSRRQPPQSQRQTPAPLAAGPHQFASTPRFHVSATPRQTTAQQPPPFSTPAPATTRSRATPYEPWSDAIDTSPISPDIPRDEALGQHLLNESIEIDSPSASRSLSGDDERPPKRRRLSISPEADLSPGMGLAEESMRVDVEFRETTSSPPPYDNRTPSKSLANPEGSMTGSEPASPTVPTARRPTFRDAPRFKTNEVPTGATDRPPLPDAFSPQRRGTKFVPGGLAAEVRDWLVQVKGASEYDRPVGSSVQMNVHEARDGGSMWIVAAHEAYDCTKQDGNPTSVILAGDGRLSGLSGRNAVTSGGTVSMYQPMWDIDLGRLGRFAVACDWEATD